MPREKPLVTYIIPSYNHGQYIKTAIESILQQSYRKTELIIVDDGSTDESHSVIGKYSNVPGIQTILRKENRGQSFSVNEALNHAKGEYIGYLASDDWHLPDKTSKQMALFLNCPQSVGVVYGRGARYYEDTGETKVMDYCLHRGRIFEHLMASNIVYPITPIFRRECFTKIPLDNSYRAEGEAYLQKLSLHYEFDYVDDVVSVMRDHSRNTGKMTSAMYIDNIRYTEELFASCHVPEEYSYLKHKRLAMLHRMYGLEHLLNFGPKQTIRSALWKAMIYDRKFAADKGILLGLLLTFLPGRTSTLAARIALNLKTQRLSGR